MLTIPLSLLPWVIYQASLTDRLKALIGNARLDVLGQRWEIPDRFDEQVLNIKDKSILHREILMWGGDEPYWYARTIIPSATYYTDEKLFDRLKTESLGDLIFNDVRIKRVYLEHYPIDKSTIEYDWLTTFMHQKTEILWVRKSQFMLDNASFFLIEILLPSLMRDSK